MLKKNALIVLSSLLFGVLFRLPLMAERASFQPSPQPAPKTFPQAFPHTFPKTVYVFDAMPLRRLDLHVRENAEHVWDTLDVLATLQGLVNRDSPQFYLLYTQGFGVDTDTFWLNWFRGPNGWLRQSEIKPVRNLTDAVTMFRSAYSGLVVYDPNVPATANVAATAAGCDGLLPVRYDPASDSVFTLLTKQMKIPVSLWLVHPDGSSKFTGQGMIPDIGTRSSGSAKVDAYRWAIAKYLETGKCSPLFAAYYIDSFWLNAPYRSSPDMHTLSDHDYFISKKAFFFDLSPWGDERPNDDLHQPLGADRETLQEIMQILAKQAGGQMIKLGGFPPWPFKYTDSPGVGGEHQGVPTEWAFARLISEYDGYMEADAAGLGAIANASFDQHYPLADHYAQPNGKPTRKDWLARGYITPKNKVAAKVFVGFYVGDYDSPSWLYKAVPAFFQDPARGKVPLGWAFDPNLSDRAPEAMVYAYQEATPDDFFITGDSGAGYLNARALSARPDSKLPSGLAAWAQFSRKAYTKWSMSITGFLLDGAAGASGDAEFSAYRAFSPDGIGTHFDPGPELHEGIPTCPVSGLPDNIDQAADSIAQKAGRGGGPIFLWERSVLKSPGWYLQLAEKLKEKYPKLNVEIVDPYTLFGLIEFEATQGHF